MAAFEYRRIKPGDTFGSWIVTGGLTRTKAKKPALAFPCRCQCGAERVIEAYSLCHHGTSSCRSCGNNQARAESSARRIKPGDCFGLWTVKGDRVTLLTGQQSHSAFPCRCVCGEERLVRAYSLLGGGSQSCGCIGRATSRQRLMSHGQSNGRLNRIWRAMRGRCANPRHSSYKNYGGRGITVCPEWQDFATFLAWSLANGYANDLTIDRIDNDAGYSPGNCRWTTMAEQAKNKRNSRGKGVRAKR